MCLAISLFLTKKKCFFVTFLNELFIDVLNICLFFSHTYKPIYIKITQYSKINFKYKLKKKCMIWYDLNLCSMIVNLIVKLKKPISF